MSSNIYSLRLIDMKEIKPSPRRKRPSQFVGKTFYLPIPLAKKIEEQAEQEFGGNQSALATEALSRGLGVEIPVEAMPA